MGRVAEWFFSVIALVSGLHHIIVLHKKDIIQKMGIGFQKFDILGQDRTKTDHLFWGVNMRKNDGLWTMSPDVMQKRLESLPWVCSAIVRRIFPGTIFVHLKEYKPFAIWYMKGSRCILDKNGHAIGNVQLRPGESEKLLHVGGDQAPENMTDLVNALCDHPLLHKIKLAVFLRSGRWDLYLRDGALIQCPEEQISAAIAQMKPYSEKLSRATVVDLRFPGRIFYQHKMEQGKP